jgi:hypothetical protein
MKGESKFVLIKIVAIYFLFLLPLVSFAVEYTPLIRIPGLENINSTGFEKYLEIIYVLAIIGAAFIAVGKLLLAGLQYVGADVVTDKADAKKNIKSAIIGLVIILLATTLLRTINPQLVNLSALPNAPSSQYLHRPIAEVFNPGENLNIDINNGAQIIKMKKICEESGGRALITIETDTSGEIDRAYRKVSCVEPINSNEKFAEHLSSLSLSDTEKASLQKEFSRIIVPKETAISDAEMISIFAEARNLILERNPLEVYQLDVEYISYLSKHLNDGLEQSEAERQALVNLAQSNMLFVTKYVPNDPFSYGRESLCEEAGGTYKVVDKHEICV